MFSQTAGSVGAFVEVGGQAAAWHNGEKPLSVGAPASRRRRRGRGKCTAAAAAAAPPTAENCCACWGLPAGQRTRNELWIKLPGVTSEQRECMRADRADLKTCAPSGVHQWCGLPLSMQQGFGKQRPLLFKMGVTGLHPCLLQRPSLLTCTGWGPSVLC